MIVCDLIVGLGIHLRKAKVSEAGGKISILACRRTISKESAHIIHEYIRNWAYQIYWLGHVVSWEYSEAELLALTFTRTAPRTQQVSSTSCALLYNHAHYYSIWQNFSCKRVICVQSERNKRLWYLIFATNYTVHLRVSIALYLATKQRSGGESNLIRNVVKHGIVKAFTCGDVYIKLWRHVSEIMQWIFKSRA